MPKKTMQRIELEVTIETSGNVNYHVRGVKGKQCISETEFLDDNLGEVLEKEVTPDFYEHPVRIKPHLQVKR